MNINLLVGTREKEIFKNKQIQSELVSNNFKEANKNQYNKFNIKCASSQAIRVQSSNNGLKRKRDPNDLFNLFGDTEEPDYDEELKEKLNKKMNVKELDNNKPKSIKLCSIEALYKLKGKKFPVVPAKKKPEDDSTSNTNDNTPIPNPESSNGNTSQANINPNEISLIEEDEPDDSGQNNSNSTSTTSKPSARMSLKSISLMGNGNNSSNLGNSVEEDVIMLDENGDEMNEETQEAAMPEKIDKLRTEANMKLRKHMTVKLHKTL